MHPDSIRHHLVARGIAPETLEALDRDAAIDLDAWFTGFRDEQSAVLDTVSLLRRHPLMPKDVLIHGLVIDTATGELRVLDKGHPDQTAAKG